MILTDKNTITNRYIRKKITQDSEVKQESVENELWIPIYRWSYKENDYRSYGI